MDKIIIYIGGIRIDMVTLIIIACAIISIICVVMAYKKWRKSSETAKIKPSSNPVDVAEKLRTLESLQELLNTGVITQEEFDAKKKQLLGPQ